MATVTATRTVNAPLAEVWASWDEFADIRKFHPDLRDSYLLADSAATGLGALRQCDFKDGKTYLKEKIIGYEPRQWLVIDIYETSAPIKKAGASFDFKALGPSQTEVTMRLEFTPRMGLLGQLMLPMMKRQFAKSVTGLLEGNAAYVESQPRLQAA
ncbi:SRPBCC family protein [Bauldia sp.]|uniref:SRPBCC family protein n=1 Tax=Bauldia sp. TaxID=2575872 RepID=UPI003BABCC78